MKRIIVMTLFLVFAFTGSAFADLMDGIQLSYTMDGDALDVSGNGNDGDVFGASLTTDRFGNSNHAFEFDGTDDYIDIWSAPEINENIDTTQGAISVWFRIDEWKQTYIYNYGVGGVLYDTFYLSIGDNRTNLRATLFDGNGFTSSDLSLDNWYHVVQTWTTDGILEVYLNGILEITSSYTPGLSFPDTSRFVLGRCGDLDYRYFDGAIDDFIIYNRSLSEAEIQQLFQASNPVPEPTTMLLLGAGLTGLAAARRRKKQA